MPTQACRQDGKPGYKGGPTLKCYTYPPGDDTARREAKRRAIIQGIAVEHRRGKQGLDGEQLSALLEQAVLDAEQQHLPALTAVWQQALERAGAEAARRFALTAAADWQPPPEGWTLTPAAITALTVRLNRELAGLRAEIVETVGQSALARVEIVFNRSRPLARSILEQAAKRTGARLDEAVQFELRKIVADAYEQGLAVRETAQAIQTSIVEAARWQAEMLARTDLTSLANASSKAAAQQAGMQFKSWLSSRDDRVRPDHVEADGQTVPIGEPFVVCEGETADYPGDPALSDGCAANCRCTLIYADSLDEAQGLLASAGVGMMEPMASVRQQRRRRKRLAARAGTAPSEQMAQMPAGMHEMPGGVKACQMNGTPGYSGGAQCHMHDGTETGMRSAMRKAQADARKTKAAVTASARPIAFHGTAAIEGKLSDDNSVAPRILLPDSLSWPEMPVSFMAQTKTAEGHDGAGVAGRIDEFTRRKGTGRIRSIDLAGELTTPFGLDEIAPMLEDETMKYVSADLGASEWALVDRDSLAVVPEAEFDLAEATDGRYALGLVSGKIKAVTLVATQAIEGAMVALTASADEQGIAIEDLGDGEIRAVIPLTEFTVDHGQALVAAAAPMRPPADWLNMPELPGKMPLTVTEDGRVYGHLATWDSCHMAFLPSCLPPPRSPSNYAYFHVCELDTDDGGVVTVGKLMFSPTDGGHADRHLSAGKATAYYDRTGMAAAYLRVTDGEHGIWACGALNPDLSDAQRQEMRRKLRLNPPSGDWRPVNGQYELICALAVAVPGFPVPRAGATVTVTASADGVELSEAIIASSGAFEADESALAALEQDGLLDSELQAERRLRTLAARAEGGLDALAALVE